MSQQYSPDDIDHLLEEKRKNFILRDLEEVKPNIFVSISEHTQIDFRLHQFLSKSGKSRIRG